MPLNRRNIRKIGHKFINVMNSMFPAQLTKKEENLRIWFEIVGDESLRLDYDLDEESLVFDLGGYKGQWASDIFSKYVCRIFIFEPVTEFAKRIRGRFIKNEYISVFEFGLSSKNSFANISINMDSSSIYKNSSDLQEIRLVEAIDFMKEHFIQEIDLMKINIEGAEFDLLNHLIDTEFIHNIKDIQVQFHDFLPEAETRMGKIQEKLRETHEITYQYKFVWENWRRKQNL